MVALTRRRAMLVFSCLLAGSWRVILAQTPLVGCVSEPAIGKVVGVITRFRQKGESKSYGSLELVRRTIRRTIPERLREKGYEVIVVDTTGLPAEAGKLSRGKIAATIARQNLTALVVVEFEFWESRTIWTTPPEATVVGRWPSFKRYDARQPYPQATWEEWVFDQGGAVQCHTTAVARAGWVAERAVQAANYEALLDRLITLKVPLFVKPIERWAGELAADPGVLNSVPRYAADSASLTFASISAGMDHACALTPAGAAYCWGSNSDGQLGGPALDTCAEVTPNFVAPQSTPCSPSPVPVAGGLTFKSIRTGDGYTCGLTSAGEAYCWGLTFNSSRIGNGTTERRAGDKYSCQLMPSGAEYCSRPNTVRLGDSTRENRAAPARVTADVPFDSLYLESYYACGLTPSGEAHCWGANSFGQLGDSTRTHRGSPAPVKGGLAFATLVLGFEGVCGLTPTGAAYCWGGMANIGSLSQQTPSMVPLVVGQGPLATLAITSYGKACGLGLDGVASCWSPGSKPYLVGGGTPLRLIAFREDGVLCGRARASEDNYCWKRGFENLPPQRLGKPVKAFAGLSFTSTARGGGVVVNAWFVDAKGSETIESRQQSRHGGFTCGITGAGAAYCWGSNNRGQLGDRTKTVRATPARVR